MAPLLAPPKGLTRWLRRRNGPTILQDRKHAGTVDVTGEQPSEVEETLRWARFAGLWVVWPDEHHRYFQVDCLRCGATFLLPPTPTWIVDVVLALDRFIARHTEHDGRGDRTR
jgi:hypothetical protein